MGCGGSDVVNDLQQLIHDMADEIEHSDLPASEIAAQMREAADDMTLKEEET